MKNPWVSDWVIWVVMECSCHNLSIFPGLFGSGFGGHAGNWVLSFCVRIVFPAVHILTAVGVNAQ
jgi:hypothetical protein